MIQSRNPRVRLALGAAGLLCWGAFAGAALAQAPHAIQTISPGILRQQPVTQGDLQALRAEVDALKADLAATKARLADAEKNAGDAHFIANVAIQWVNKNGPAAQAAGQWVASNGQGAAAAASWVSANGAAAQQVAAAFPNHTHTYGQTFVNFKSRNFVIDSHVTGDDMALGSVIIGTGQTPTPTSGPH